MHTGLMFVFMIAFLPLAMAKQGLHSFMRQGARQHDVVPLGARDFAGQAFIEGVGDSDWLVLFCGNAEPCHEFRQKFRRMSASLSGSPVLSSSRVHFAEVNCATHADLCRQQAFDGSDANVTVVRYRRGDAVAMWTPSRGYHFDNWVYHEFSKRHVSREGLCSKVLRLARDVFMESVSALPDSVTTLAGIAVLAVEIAVVVWVVMTGFELWPKTAVEVAHAATAE
mmetsp:Transcript_109293/g.189664  ORF Transcript_109293/g.189664 Transcript_109293/m.189664 type:complete len:225 (-) Transcript_109293:233-907(-)